MSYLYGDSTPSPLTSNVLEFLSASVDFSVLILQADDRINAGRARLRALEAECNTDLESVDQFAELVSKSIGAGGQGARPPTAMFAARLRDLVGETHHASVEGIRRELAGQRSRLEAEESAIRAECVQALAALLSPHDPPDSSTVTKIVLGPQGYQAARTGVSAFGLSWALDLSTREGFWEEPVRVERFNPRLEIDTPQSQGWLSRDVKVKPQKLDAHIITEVLLEPGRTSFSLRSDGAGYDLVVVESNVQITRVGPPDDPSNGVFSLPPEQVPALIDLAQKVRAVAIFKGGHITRAMIGESEFHTLPSFAPFVEALVGMLGPIVREISHHSHMPDELVLRRLLGDARREELFITRSSLVEKYAGMSEPHRRLFAALGFDASAKVPRTAPPPPPGPSTAKVVKPPPPPAPITLSEADLKDEESPKLGNA